jgi:hypothetical protein
MSNDENVSRRLLLRGSAILGVAAAIEACSSDPAVVATDAGTGADGGANTTMADITVLNALLSAEYGAIKAYDAGAAILMAPPAGDPQAGSAGVLLAVAGRFQQQHRDHAAQISMAVTAAGGTPVAESSVTFTAPAGFTGSVVNVLKLACNAEKGAAIAYNGAVRALGTTTRRFLATTIEGDETQHFIVLYLLLKAAVTPNAAALITGVPNIVPASFVSNLGGTNGLQAVADLAYT